MHTDDKGEFTILLAAAMAVYERQITSVIVDVYFAALAQYPFPVVREALNRHLQDPENGRFAPKPADLIRQIASAKAQDGRPGRDEAWAIAQRAYDESATVVLTQEIIGALEVAKPLIEARDKVAGRLAFVEAYDRLVSEARVAGDHCEWHVSLGTDKSGRIAAIEGAKMLGRLPAPKADLLIEQQREAPISADGLAIVGLLSGPKQRSNEELRARWQELRGMVSSKVREEKFRRHREKLERPEDDQS